MSVTISAKLRAKIAEDEWTSNALAIAAGLNPRIVQRFVAGGEMMTTSLDQLCDFLNLRLVEGEKRKARRAKS